MSNITIELLDYVYDGASIDWDKSVVGELEVSSHSDFPLAITFSISDIRDINARKGSFSKTFKIPATKNNNQLYKSVYIVNSTSTNNISSKKPCRILINNLYSITGLLQLKSVGLSDKPQFYSCVFYGDNVGWATAIGEKLLKDLGTDGDAWDNLKGTDTGKDLVINKTGITSTWVQDSAIYKNQNSTANDIPLVYPITSYGDFNPSGIGRTIQLLETAKEYLNQSNNKVGYVGTNDLGFDYGTPDPVVDWRPCLWVYDVFKEIFLQSEYTLVSNFVETDMFKRLLFALPNFKYNNPDTRYDNNSLQIRFNNNRDILNPNTARVWNNNNSTVTTSFTNSAEALVVDEVIYPNTTTAGSATGIKFQLDGGNAYNRTQDIWYAPEYGRYDIQLENWCINFKDFSNGYTTSFGNAFDIVFKYVRVQVQKLTVGQTHWQDLGFAEGAVDLGLAAGNDAQGGATTDYTAEIESFEMTQYLNKGDQVRLHLKILAFPNKSNFTNTITGTYQLFAQRNTNIAARDGIYDIGLQPDFTQYGQTFDLKNIINKDYKQIDFIKGVAHAFNLQFTSDEASKTIYIEPFDTFYQPLSEAIDWTDKLDIGQEIQDKWLNLDIKRDVVFKYKTDSKDEKVRQRSIDYFKEIEDEYPYFETLSDEFERGTSTFENPFFAGTFNAKDLDSGSSSTPPYISCLWQEKDEKGFISPNDYARPDKGFEFLPRLLYWKNYTATGLQFDTGKIATAQLWTGKTETIAANDNLIGTDVISDRYPQATSVNRDDSTSPILTYGNVYVRDFDDVNDTYSAYVYGKGLYETYYKQMIEMYKYNPRVRVANLNLKISDIANLDFRKLIYLDGVYWRINKISDYMPQSNSTTKVELIEFPLLGDFAASIPTVNSNDGSWSNSPTSFNIYEF
jgi:hypothetical protein